MLETIQGNLRFNRDTIQVGTPGGVISVTDRDTVSLMNMAAGTMFGIGRNPKFQMALLDIRDGVIESCVVFPNEFLRLSLCGHLRHPRVLHPLFAAPGEVLVGTVERYEIGKNRVHIAVRSESLVWREQEGASRLIADLKRANGSARFEGRMEHQGGRILHAFEYVLHTGVAQLHRLLDVPATFAQFPLGQGAGWTGATEP